MLVPISRRINSTLCSATVQLIIPTETDDKKEKKKKARESFAFPSLFLAPVGSIAFTRVLLLFTRRASIDCCAGKVGKNAILTETRQHSHHHNPFSFGGSGRGVGVQGGGGAESYRRCHAPWPAYCSCTGVLLNIIKLFLQSFVAVCLGKAKSFLR